MDHESPPSQQTRPERKANGGHGNEVGGKGRGRRRGWTTTTTALKITHDLLYLGSTHRNRWHQTCIRGFALESEHVSGGWYSLRFRAWRRGNDGSWMYVFIANNPLDKFYLQKMHLNRLYDELYSVHGFLEPHFGIIHIPSGHVCLHQTTPRELTDGSKALCRSRTPLRALSGST